MKKSKAIKKAKEELLENVSRQALGVDDATVIVTPDSNPAEAHIVTKPQLTHEQLLSALYWMFDAFERSSIMFVLVHSTAESVLQKRQLEGDKIELGVRRLEWESGSKSIFDTYIQDESIETEEGEGKVRYIVNGVPVDVYIYEEDPCISSPDTVLYENESFHLPNTYQRFLEVYK